MGLFISIRSTMILVATALIASMFVPRISSFITIPHSSTTNAFARRRRRRAFIDNSNNFERIQRVLQHGGIVDARYYSIFTFQLSKSSVETMNGTSTRTLTKAEENQSNGGANAVPDDQFDTENGNSIESINSSTTRSDSHYHHHENSMNDDDDDFNKNDDNEGESINFNLSLAYQEEQSSTQINDEDNKDTSQESKRVESDNNNNDTNDDSNKTGDDGNKKSETKATSSSSSTSSSWADWSTPASSLGSLLLKRKRIEEEEIKKKIQDMSTVKSYNINDNNGNSDDNNDNGDNDAFRTRKKTTDIQDSSNDKNENENPMGLFQDEMIDGLVDFNGKNITEVQKEIDQTIKSFASEAEETLVSFIDLTKGRMDGSGMNKRVGGEDDNGKRKERNLSLQGLDAELVREVDESVTILSASRQNIMKEIEVLPSKSVRIQLQEQQQQQQQVESDTSKTQLPLSGPAHTARIERDMKQLAVSIASTVENAEQWKAFTEDGGGLLPLLECIRDGAREIENGSWGKGDVYYDDEGMIGLVEKREEAFAAACRACKTMRDLCTISKPFAAMITDSILRANVIWSEPVQHKDGKTTLDGGLISNLVTLLHFSQQSDNLYNAKSRRQKIRRAFRNRGGVQRLGNRRQKRNARKRCGLYVTQLLLEMSFASDKAVDVFRATSGLTKTVLACSSYAQAERLRRRWIRYPMEVAKRIMATEVAPNEERPFLAAASVNSGISGQTQGSANQLLAAIGYNVWYPKTAGQKGLRILCLDGGGTRGITAISSMRSIVNAIGGVEVCDAFDMIVGTSTGAIIAFLVGLRRESSAQARKRYDRLISRIFVKSALSTPMLLFTTATYDETPFNNVVGEIMRDNSMLSSRADPRVPLVFAVSSKMSSTPTQICLFRNYNYGGGEMSDTFVMDPIEAKRELGVEMEDDVYELSGMLSYKEDKRIQSPRTGASRHPGSFRVLQRAALRATTAAPTVFKPVLMGGELYCDGGIVASNPAAVAIHEARTIYPNVPIELVVSCGTGAFEEEKSAPRIGWDGIIGQIVNSATDGEQVHYILEDILGGQGSTAKLGRSQVSKTKYFRFQPIVGTSDTFPIDGTDPIKLEELSQITTDYMNEPEQLQKLNEIVNILRGNTGWKQKILSKIVALVNN